MHVTGTQLKSDRHWPGSSWNGILFRKLVAQKEGTFEGHGCLILGSSCGERPGHALYVLQNSSVLQSGGRQAGQALLITSSCTGVLESYFILVWRCCEHGAPMFLATSRVKILMILAPSCPFSSLPFGVSVPSPVSHVFPPCSEFPASLFLVKRVFCHWVPPWNRSIPLRRCCQVLKGLSPSNLSSYE